MDLRSRARAVRRFAVATTKCLAAVLLFGAAVAQASSGRSGPDYLYPAEAIGGYLEPVSRLQSGATLSKPAALTSYRAFDGQSYNLQEYRGRYVSVLLPDAVDEGPFFTADHISEMVDRLDELYLLYKEILHLEPQGSGLLNIAFVAETCGMGCGLLGAKGIEIRSIPLNYELIIRELDAGRLEAILVHEMVHNFDAYARHLHYLPDHPHAWTDFFQYFAAYRYGRNTLSNEAPDDLYQSPLAAAWKHYVADDSASWEHCALDGNCSGEGLSANTVWAMPYYRMESLYGTEAILRSFAFLSDYVTHNVAPASDLEKESLRIVSLAHGAGMNISCHMDSLKWPLPADLVSTLNRDYGPPDPLCDDLDQDGFVRITGDCDESDPTRHVLSEETPDNGFDDDCDGFTDEQSLVESDYGNKADNFGQVSRLDLPFEVTGSLADSKDTDVFSFPGAAAGRVHVTLCAGAGFKGWAVGLDPDGNFLEEGNWYVYRSGAGCASVTFDFSRFGSGSVAVMPDASSGDYSLTVAAASDMPDDLSAWLSALPRATGGVRLQVDDSRGELARLGADELELWIPGTEVRRSVPYSTAAAVTLDRSSAPQLSDGSLYLARMRPKADGKPLAAFSAGHLFRYNAGAASPPQVDHRYSGAWFDPGHEGEGFIVEVLENDRAVVYWFTYRDDGRQRWMIGVGEVSGNRIVVEEMMESSGGRFGKDFDPAEVRLQTAGSLNISFQGCSEALANYSIDNVGGSQALTRLTHVYGHRCGVGDSPPASDLSGSWFDPAHDGEGFVVELVGPDQAAVYWFTYNAQGEQTWLFNTGIVKDDGIVFPELLQPVGGQFGRSFDPATVRLDPWGSLELRLNCRGGQATYQPQASGFSSGTQNLVSLTRLQNSGCSP